MAKGYKSLHPLTAEVLQELGVPDKHVTQGYGNASASAGYHKAEGYYKGRQFSSCVDLAWRDDYVNPRWKSRAVAAGLVPFFRDWPGNRHVHCVHVGLRTTNGSVAILDGPRMQIVDYTRGLNGLVGHAKLRGELAPTAQERKAVLDVYKAWAPNYATTVYLNGKRLPCYAWLHGLTGRVMAEVRPLIEGLGGRILDTTSQGLLVRTPCGDLLNILGCQMCGDFLRGFVRDIVMGMSREGKVAYAYVEDGPDRVDITVNAETE